MRAAPPVAKDGPRINDDIREREVHLIDRDGANRGTVSISDALALAQEAGLDLVEISPNAKPPVCKLLAMIRFCGEGDKVKVTLRFRGREMAHQELGIRLLDRLKGDTEKVAKVEMDARFEGRQMVMVLAPK